MRKRLMFFVSLFVMLMILLAGCSSSGQKGGLSLVSKEASQEIARSFVLNEATFKFDGMAETLELLAASTQGSPDAWQFTFGFQSRHSGYGDRTGMILLQVITPHTAVIAVRGGKVVSAMMDERWDTMAQELIGN